MSQDTPSNTKPWAGRFTEATDGFVDTFGASILFDQRLYRHDIEGSIAHATMLCHVGVLRPDECEAICTGLQEIKQEIEQGNFNWQIELEDVHMNIEARLTQRIGDAGKKLHTGRSRNDQVATDLRLYLREACAGIREQLASLQGVIIHLAEAEAETIMPGFTHLQTAQPITFGHHMLAWNAMLQRDRERLADCQQRINIMPLGSAALAGTSYPIDRAYTAKLLGFPALCENSLDAVSDRDFVVEFIAAAALIMMHLSRFAEELILWSTAQFDFIELSDGFCTGSSIMPQKKNPDVPELIRGKTGRINGHLVAMLSILKGQPLAYNKDNQEDKEPLFDTVDTINGCLHVFTEMLPAMSLHRDKMRHAAGQGFSTATDLADYLVRQGIPFRDAHEIVGKAVRYCINHDIGLTDMPLTALQGLCPLVAEDVFVVLALDGSVAARDHIGGTAPRQVHLAVARARHQLGTHTQGTR